VRPERSTSIPLGISSQFTLRKTVRMGSRLSVHSAKSIGKGQQARTPRQRSPKKSSFNDTLSPSLGDWPEATTQPRDHSLAVLLVMRDELPQSPSVFALIIQKHAFWAGRELQPRGR
jgi:hypothetical protein